MASWFRCPRADALRHPDSGERAAEGNRDLQRSCGACLLCNGAAIADKPAFEWDRATLKLIAEGDAAKGKQVAKKQKCSRCHGDTGVSDEDDTPSIAGQVPSYHFKQLMDYQSGDRDSRTMAKVARKLTREDMVDLAAHFAAQKPEPAMKQGQPMLVYEGDMQGLLLPCSICHGKRGEGMDLEVPAIAGQKIEHFIEILEAFREGDRENDHYGRMRCIAEQLSYDEIEELANYYSAKSAEDDDSQFDLVTQSRRRGRVFSQIAAGTHAGRFLFYCNPGPGPW